MFEKTCPWCGTKNAEVVWQCNACGANVSEIVQHETGTKEISEIASGAWTWADQISTYTFWGLLLFFVLSSVGIGAVRSFLPLFLQDRYSLVEPTLFYSLMGLSQFAGFYAAWAASRGRTKVMLVLAGLLLVAGALLTAFPMPRVSVTVWHLGAVLLGFAMGTVLLAVPAILAGGLGGMRAFVVAFGIVFAVEMLGQMVSFSLYALASDWLGSPAMLWLAAGAPFLGLLFFLPVRSSLFTGPPPPRGYPLTPHYREPVGVFLLGLIVPFYWAYWLYRAHGEVTSLAPSRAILSPRGAAAAAFIPLLLPVMTTTLVDALNGRAAEEGRPPASSAWVVFILSLPVVYPMGLALTQSAINRAMGSAHQTVK
jgi:hypothetical protein